MPGLRFDGLKTSYPSITLPATPLLAQQSFAGADILNWKDLSPRLGVAYDLFGDGKTAVKASVSRYVLQQGLELYRGG